MRGPPPWPPGLRRATGGPGLRMNRRNCHAHDLRDHHQPRPAERIGHRRRRAVGPAGSASHPVRRVWQLHSRAWPAQWDHGGRRRRSNWELAVPPDPRGETPLSLVIALHGGGEFYSSERVLALAEEEGFVAVAPRDAYQDFWMMWDPQLPGYDLSLDNPDIALVDALIDQLGEELCLDLARVYATGFCVGGGGALVLGCVLDERLAAVAPVSSAFDPGDACNTSDPSRSWPSTGPTTRPPPSRGALPPQTGS